MTRIAFLVFLCTAIPAHAQLTKCIDERGRVHYTDKPIPGCKPTAVQPAPPPKAPAPQAQPKPAAKPAAKAAVAKAPVEPPPSTTECKAAREQWEWLNSDRGKGIENRPTRIGQVEQIMRKCRY